MSRNGINPSFFPGPAVLMPLRSDWPAFYTQCPTRTSGIRLPLVGMDGEPPILVSACLAGLATTHDGKAKPHPKVMELVRQGRAILVCPEQLGGLPTPRPCAEIAAASASASGARVLAGEAQVVYVDGTDVTANYLRGAREALKAARLAGSTKAILKARSPSCGKDRIHDGTFAGVLKPGQGVTAALLAQEGLDILSEDDLEGLEG